ncbi:hypothetical protein BKA62DRAFT_139377 [Auriculariales sp. MPI-PUGE-AT-0066]|nr:hypothetical protein BKA62DRAFT_139377 [Auriculariales sp. MPI-PUGE-AT-0066]
MSEHRATRRRRQTMPGATSSLALATSQPAECAPAAGDAAVTDNIQPNATDLDLGDLSDLTEPEDDPDFALFSRSSSNDAHAPTPEASTSSARVTKQPASVSSPGKRRQKRKAAHSDDENNVTRSPKRQRKSLGLVAAPKHTIRRRVSDPGLSAAAVASDMWSLTVIFTGDYAFVRLDRKGMVIDGNKPAESTRGYWWPAKIVSDMKEKSLCLFGDDKHGKQRSVQVNTPSANNILTYYTTSPNSRTPRFTAKTFTNNSEFLALSTRFTRACSALRKDSSFDDMDIDDDETPSSASSTPAQPAPEPTPQVPTPSPSPQPEIRPWKPPPRGDITMKIPGELVLARFKHSPPEGDHFPAKVEKYFPPTQPGSVPRYQVVFADGQRQKLNREHFHRTYEDGFKTCSLGEMLLKNPAGDDFDLDLALNRRSPSPLPPMPSREESACFDELSLKQQIMLVTPILQAILLAQFEPAIYRHSQFMKGRKARSDLYQMAGFGDIGESEYEEITHIVSQWALGNERWATRLEDDDLLVPEATTGFATTEPAGLASPPPSLESSGQSLEADAAATAEIAARVPLPSSPRLDTTGSPSASPQPISSPPAIDLSQPAIPPSSPALPSSSQLAPVSPSRSIQLTTIQADLEERQSSRQSSHGHLNGCDAYEKLSRSERLQYCTDVLTPEAVIQLLLWRNGKRRESGPLSDVAAEKTLHDMGHEFATQPAPGPIDAWVDTILRKREVYDKKRNRNGLKKMEHAVEAQSREVGGKALRSLKQPNYRA